LDDSIFSTVDAVGMYSNINTDHALHIMSRWLDLHHNDIPSNFPHMKVLKGLNIIMKNKVFTFGNRCWLQLNGIAMGTSCTCVYATTQYTIRFMKKLLLHTIIVSHQQFCGRLMEGWIFKKKEHRRGFGTNVFALWVGVLYA
jgi:hypothetical protein